MTWTLFVRRPGGTRPTARPRHGLRPVEHLEERLAPSTAYYHLANGPFSQNWASHPFTTDNNWNGVPSIVGYSGAGLAAAGQDPQTVTADGATGSGIVTANQSNPAGLTSGGIADFNGIAQPTVGLKGDGTNNAPFLQVYLDTTGVRNVVFSYQLRDLETSFAPNPLPFALQYRVGSTGSFTSLPAGFVADASVDTSGLTSVRVTLPGDAYDQAQVQVRILTTDQGGGVNHWVGVDNIQVTGTAAAAANLIFAVDSSATVLTLSGNALGHDMMPQGAGSLTDHFSGTVATAWDRAAGTLGFVGASTNLVAGISGNWKPDMNGDLNPMPANYGGLVQLIGSLVVANAALRDATASISTTTPLALTAGGGGTYSFPGTPTLTITNGNLDYNVPLGIGQGRTSISNQSASNAAANGTLQDMGGGVYRLTLPIDVTLNEMISGQPASLHIVGTLVANASLASVTLGLSADGVTPSANNAVVYNPGDPAIALAPAATVTGPGSLTSMTVTLTNRPDGAAESLTVNTTGTALSASAYDPATGRITVTGPGSAADFQTVLQTLMYSNTAAGSTNLDNRLVEVAVSDGTNSSLVRTVVVSPPNQAPTVTVPADQTTTGTTPVVFSTATSTAITVGDVDALGAFEVLTISVSNGILNLNSGSSSYGRVQISGDGTGTVTVIGSLADLNAVLDGLTYTATSGFSGTDVLSVSVNDLGQTGPGGPLTGSNQLNIFVT